MSADWLNRVHFGDCLETLRRMPDGIVQTCVTSPPYYGLRSYMPGGVRLRSDLTPEKRAAVIAELAASDIFPLSQSSE